MLYPITVFLSAYLVFQIQPLIAKMLMPLFGGGAAIWITCLLFFQTFLLLGYLYAHGLTTRFAPKRQLWLHGGLLILSLAFLPIGLVFDGHNINAGPLWQISLLLLVSIGLPYLVLSSTAPLVQRWLSYTERGSVPYRLYAYSNAGSFVGLLIYPFVIEPGLPLQQQSLMWSGGFVLFLLCFALLAKHLLRQLSSAKALPVESPSEDSAPNRRRGLLWTALSFTGVVLLVSTTNAMTQNVPPVPFLWIMPLCIYLLSFIISFHHSRWYVRWYWFVLFAFSSVAAVLLFFIGSQFDIWTQIGLYSLILLSGCMICHGELARLKPTVEQLTLFYLYLAFGGALGSVFVSLIAPALFNHFYEFPLAILAVYALLLCCLGDRTAAYENASSAIFGYSQASLLKGGSLAMLLLTGMLFYTLNNTYTQFDVDASRNFYGILSVKDVTVAGKPQRRLVDGTTSHGTQSLASQEAMQPLSYYRADTGAALLLKHFSSEQPLHAGFIGLGAGALAAYGKAGDRYDFYELNPDVLRMAQTHFTFLQNSQANVDVKLGDGRINLRQEFEQEGAKQFDLLLLDAFSGDAIPNHLLTLEAFELYWQHLKTDGVMAVHISNTHLELTPLIRGLADALNKQAVYLKLAANNNETHSAQWVLLGNNPDFFNHPEIKSRISPWPLSADKNLVWTDDYSNLLSVLK